MTAMTRAAEGGPPAEYTLRYLVHLIRHHRRQLVYAHLVAIAATAASVPLPLLMPLLVDEVLLEQPESLVPLIQAWFPEAWHGPVLYVGLILLFAVFLRITAILLNAVQVRELATISKDMVYRLRCQLLQRLERTTLSEYETLGSGTVSAHLVTDLQTIDDFVAITVGKFVVAGLTIVGTAAVLLWLHWGLALFILCTNPLVIYFTIVLGRRVKELKKHENSAIEHFQQALTETLDGIHQIRAHNRERHYILRVMDEARGVRDWSTAYFWKSEMANRASGTVFLLGFDIFRAVSMLMVVFSDLSIGEMMAVFGYLWFMISPVQELLGVQYAYYAASAALSRVNRILKFQEEPRHPHIYDPFSNVLTASLELESIHFSFIPEQPVLNGITLRVATGEKVAFVGASGAGKSTLMQVLLGLYPADAGEIRFGGKSVRNIGFDTVRNHVAIVLQHPTLFNDTLRSNLTLGVSLSDDALWDALRVSQLREWAQALPQQLDTPLGVDGIRLSGGQRQRLSIARTVLMDPKILILDEATSMLDTQIEDRLHRDLFARFEGRTTLIVAHRLSAVRHADHVYVMEDGRIIEQGGPQQLMDQDGLYAKLYSGQHH